MDPGRRKFQDGDIVIHQVGTSHPTGVIQRLVIEADIDRDHLYYFVKFADHELGVQVLAEDTLHLVQRDPA